MLPDYVDLLDLPFAGAPVLMEGATPPGTHSAGPLAELLAGPLPAETLEHRSNMVGQRGRDLPVVVVSCAEPGAKVLLQDLPWVVEQRPAVVEDTAAYPRPEVAIAAAHLVEVETHTAGNRVPLHACLRRGFLHERLGLGEAQRFNRQWGEPAA